MITTQSESLSAEENFPLTFYGYLKTDKFVKVGNVYLIAERCGIPSRVFDAVFNAADHIDFLALRKKLLKATGLS